MGRVNVVGVLNGFGLERDTLLLARALEELGHDVWVNNRRFAAFDRSRVWQLLDRTGQFLRKQVNARAGKPLHDLNIYLQSISPVWLETARRHVWIPNPDWTSPEFLARSRHLDEIWCKTEHALDIYEPYGEVRYLGFTSEDRGLDGKRDEESRAACHLAGRSPLKGTAAVLDAWRAHPEWPTVTILRRDAPEGPPLPANVRLIEGYISDAELQTLQNEHWLHICPSETEGWGHYIVEAMSCAATVLTTDAPPMNELVADDRGFLVRAEAAGDHMLATRYQVDAGDLAATLNRAFQADGETRRQLGARSREWFERNDRAFRGRLAKLTDALV